MNWQCETRVWQCWWSKLIPPRRERGSRVAPEGIGLDRAFDDQQAPDRTAVTAATGSIDLRGDTATMSGARWSTPANAR